MNTALLQLNIIKTASERAHKVKPPEYCRGPLYPMEYIHAQNFGLNPEWLRTDPHRAVDTLFRNLKQRKIPELQYKEGVAKDYKLTASDLAQRASDFSVRHQANMRDTSWRPLKRYTDAWTEAHRIKNPDEYDGEGKYVLSDKTKEDFLNPDNFGKPGRGGVRTDSIAHRFFSS